MTAKPGFIAKVLQQMHKRKSKSFDRLHFAPNYQKSKRFLLVWNNQLSETNKRVVQEFIQELLQDGKEVTRMIYFDVKKKEETPLVPESNTFHTGKWDFDRTKFPKDDGLKNLLRKDYDFVISMDMEQNWYILGMVSIAKAACRFGLSTTAQSNPTGVYDILLKQDTTNPDLNLYLCDVKATLKKLG